MKIDQGRMQVMFGPKAMHLPTHTQRTWWHGTMGWLRGNTMHIHGRYTYRTYTAGAGEMAQSLSLARPPHGSRAATTTAERAEGE